MFKKISKILISLSLLSSSIFAIEVDDLVQKAYKAAYYGGDDGKAVVNMKIVDKKGKERIRKILMLRKDIEDNGRQKYFIYFQKPADVKKMTFMVHKDLDKGDKRWLYMPALDMIRKIESSDKRASFVGSDFTYEDISGRSLEADKHEITEENDNYYVLKNTPNSKEDFEYYTVWIDKKTFIPVKSEYFNEKNEIFRRISATKVESIEGIDTIIEMKAENLETGGYTINTFENIDYNIGIDEKIFTERYLRKPPRKYIR